MNPESDRSAPLTLDESLRLVAFLAERGHTRAAFDVVSRVAYTAMVNTLAAEGGAVAR